MFGYFKTDRNCPGDLKKENKKYYCFLCRSLKRYYGGHTRWILSYDVSFFLLLTAKEGCLDGLCKVPCCGVPKPLCGALMEPEAKKAAALNILLTAAKLEDDILDENRFAARLLRLFYGGAIRKAQKDQPRMWQIISGEYEEIRRLEQENGQLSALEDCFAELMCRVAKECFGLADEDKLNALAMAARWLYFVDAVDDLDKDLTRGSFNPLAKFTSFAILKNRNYPFLAEHLSELYNAAPIRLPRTTAGRVAERILLKGIPEITVQVLTGRRGRP